MKIPRQQLFSAILLILFCGEVGLFLIVYPWTDRWDTNLFGTLIPSWYWLWNNAYVRGGISGLGLVNLYISMGEIFRLWRLARAH